MLKLKDIATIADIKPAINLSDTDSMPDEIVDTFKFSEDIDQIFDAILGKIDSGKGYGFFLKGSRGTGKSHFESYLELMFKRGLPPLEKYPRARNLQMRVIRLPLLRFPASESFESILQTVLKDTEPIKDRDVFYAKHFSVPTLLLIDELSEYLLSKSKAGTKNEFYEDVRTLTYLAEFAWSNPFWIVAALQQFLEETGQIDTEISARLKDRSVNLKLTVSHIEDLIDKRVVLKNDKAEAVIKTVYAALKKNYPRIQIKLEEFKKTYPLHPATAQFLTGLETIYSGSRGIIQFTAAEANKIIDKKADDLDTLITPDVIFDHFEDRIRELTEYSKLATVVYEYYKKHIREILPNSDLQAAGLAAIKVLILTEISPTEKKKNAGDIAEMLGKQMGTISAFVNYEMIQELVLDPIVAHQMFIKKEGYDYFIDPKIDEGSRVRAKVKAQREVLSDRQFLMNRICSMVNLQQLPLQSIGDGKLEQFTWQNSVRLCSAYVFKGESFKKVDMDKALGGLHVNFDTRLIIFTPFLENRTFYQTIKDTYPPEDLPLVVFWIPRAPTDNELSFIESYVSKKLLTDEFPILVTELKKEEAEFFKTITNIYFEGDIMTSSGSRFSTVNTAGGLPFNKFSSFLFEESLTQIHPKHQSAAPRGEVLFISTQQQSSLYSSFIRPGKITVDDAEKRGLYSYINGLLKPLGMARLKGNSFIMGVEEDSEIVTFILDFIRMDDSLHNLRAVMKKGDWGLSDVQFRLLIASLISLGQLVGYRDSEPVELTSYDALAQGEINRLKSGKSLAPDLIPYIEYGRFIWGEVGEMPTPLTQRSMWETAKDFIRETRKLISDLETFSKQYGGSPVLKKVRFDSTLIKRISMFLGSITLTMPAPDGIERFLIHFKDNNEAEADHDYLNRLRKLFVEQFDTLSRCFSYLSDPALRHVDQLPGTSESLKERKDILLIHLDEFFTSLEGFDSLKAEWESFYDDFSNAYVKEHDSYYGNDVFSHKKDIDDSAEAKALKKISMTIRAATFNGEWFQLQPEFEKLPDKCRSDVRGDLFQRPICRCGYKMGAEPPVVASDLKELCTEGILNFARFLQGNRGRLESYILSIKNPVTLKSLSKLMGFNIDKVSPSAVIPLLSDEVLAELNTALSNGGWDVKEINIDDFVSVVRGRRFRLEDLKSIFSKWVGSEEQAIIHVRDQNSSLATSLKECIAKYGEQGERLGLDIERELSDQPLLNLEDFQRGNASLPVFDRIRFEAYSKDQLLGLLAKEEVAVLKRKIRTEIFHRAWGRPIADETLQSVVDPAAKSLLAICKVYCDGAKYNGIDKFTKVLAPLNLMHQRLKYDNATSSTVDDDIVAQIEAAYSAIEKEYNKSSEKFAGAKDERYLMEELASTVIIFDGLRYDLWMMLKEIMQSEGWTIKDTPYLLPMPTTTNNFRQVIGIGEDRSGHIKGKSFALLKWAEKDAGRKAIKQLLKGDADIKLLHFNFIDSKMHATTLDLYPLYVIIKEEFTTGILPLLRDIRSFIIVSDHGFARSKNIKERYSHGGDSSWERVLPFVQVTG